MPEIEEIILQGRRLSLKNLSKRYDDGVVKRDVIDYYLKVSDYILPHIAERPFCMVSYPDGVGGKSFYRKRCPESAPEWLARARIPSPSSSETSPNSEYIDWCLVNDTPSLIYMANLGVAEMHVWFSRVSSLDLADVAVIDLDPSGKTDISHCVKAANLFDKAFRRLGLDYVPATSGSRGLHLFIPIVPTPFADVRNFLEPLCKAMECAAPKLVTCERSLSKRGDRVYLDYVQVSRGKTLAAPYSLRVRKGFPFSAPLLPKELSSSLDPHRFNLFTLDERLKKVGDLSAALLSSTQKLPDLR